MLHYHFDTVKMVPMFTNHSMGLKKLITLGVAFYNLFEIVFFSGLYHASVILYKY